jgi:hypothetical protein
MGQFWRRLVPDKRPDFTLEALGPPRNQMQRGRAVSPWSQVRPTTESAAARFEAEPSTLEVVGFLASERHHENAWTRSLYAGGCGPQGTACPVARRRGAALQWRHVGGAKRALALRHEGSLRKEGQ